MVINGWMAQDPGGDDRTDVAVAASPAKAQQREDREESPLLYKPKHVWEQIDDDQKKQAMAFAEGYKQFLTEVKTEREGVVWAVTRARSLGYVPFVPEQAGSLRPGDKVFWINRDKGVMLAHIGQRPLDDGILLVGAHLDAPRIDLKPNPLYQDEQMALFKTHYYGGIKKYQWLALPLALHGVTVRGDGVRCPVVVGEAPEDPVFMITDLLPHLAKDQMEKKLTEAVQGEGLNVLVGGLPSPHSDKKSRDDGACKLAVLEWLAARYGMKEEDFLSSEWQVVPAGPARDVGFDRAFVGGYGQDDRSCCYTAAEALFALEQVDRTAVVLLVDKEETGSDGNTGMRSRFMEHALAELVYGLQQGGALPPELAWRRCLARSRALSADVTVGLDPNFESVLDQRNAARLGYGLAIAKYTGSRGKYGTSDANAEFVGEVRQILNREKVCWQSGELGKVDQGGGGTIAQFLAVYGMEVLDCGVPLLSMHAPWELAHKADLYMAYRGYGAFMASRLP
ncbi:aminopeptidase [Heliophilum fasciatum]|uniref:M18 family aminopeptidase n=1 Tax=Heliophilum fasciatum TaxID=35700 RepID=A0A4V6NRN3_9FIRM|nr:aminopeptidase [Heliophilum fasciatum]MCW2278241.1 aspartyl aminopeptidase [Heliophilum fasciatum]TCP63866.1 aspartyl aminopeptidase [Heliophilum fasciatum]